MTDHYSIKTDIPHWPGCWRVHHECAKELLRHLANGLLVLDEHTRLSIHPVTYVRQMGDRMTKIAREIVGDDNVPREQGE
jgi:hypothetical protein